MSSLLNSLFSSTCETTFIERKSLLHLPDSPKIPMPILPISLSKSPFSLSSPLLFSTPNADVQLTSDDDPDPPQEIQTQEFLERLHRLRQDDVIVADEARPAFIALQRVADDLRSELLAARLQLEEKEIEIQELREQLQALPPSSDVLQPFISKSKRKKKKKRQQIEAVTAAAANMTRPPGSDSVTLPPPTPRPNLQPAQQQQPVQRQQQPQTQQQHRQSQPQTIYFYHDSNSDDKFLTTNDIQYTLDLINKKQNRPTNKYNIHKHATYELRQTYNKITHTTYNRNDIVILNILTNDARTTKNRPPKTLFQTKTLLSAIYDHLLSQLSPNNIILLESPPLLYEDIFPHAALSLQAAWEKGVRFAPTLIGETHVRRYDGVHIEKGYHHLLAKAVACAILRQNPHPLFGLGRPPQGIFGPWLSPRGQGMALPAYSSTAARPPPYHFRPRQMQPTRPTRPLMDIDIPRINPR